jgi:hypothetical protein
MNLKNYSSAFAIASALSSKYISRLEKNLSKLGVSYMDRLFKLKRILSPEFYADVTRRSQGSPFVPVFAFWVQDVKQVLSFNSKDAIHFASLRQLFCSLKSFYEILSNLTEPDARDEIDGLIHLVGYKRKYLLNGNIFNCNSSIFRLSST